MGYSNSEGCYIRPTTDGYGMEKTPFRSISYAFWWFFTTATTVGYGDDYPTSTLGRCVGIFTFYVGIVLLALPVTIIGQAFDRRYRVLKVEFTGSDDGEESSYCDCLYKKEVKEDVWQEHIPDERQKNYDGEWDDYHFDPDGEPFYDWGFEDDE